MNIYNPYPAPLYDTNGTLAAGAKAYFYSAGTTSSLTVYQDAGLTTPHAWPVIAGLNGVLPPIFLPYGTYRVRVTTASNGLIYDADGIENPAPPPTAGGGTVPDAELIKTGRVIWELVGGTRAGYVRMNGRTIGSTSSSATERANDDTEDLFTYLYGLPNDIAPVSTGRGANAAADWAANKTIVVPTMQGRNPCGVDDMGAAAANVIQVQTTANVVNGSPNITVASGTGICRFMHCHIDGVYAGYVTSILGTAAILSANYAGTTGTGKAARFSFAIDGQTGGSPGGIASFSMTTLEMAAHVHGVTDPTHDHAFANGQSAVQFPPFSAGSQLAGSGSGGIATLGIDATASATGISIQSNGFNIPFGLCQPMRIGTFYIKL